MRRLAPELEALMPELEQQLAAWLPEAYLVDALWVPGRKLALWLDTDAGITIQQCTQLNRKLRAWFEEKPALLPGAADAEIETSSPGLDRPLRLPRQYAKNLGRTLKVKMTDGTYVQGQLQTYDAQRMVLQPAAKPKKPAPALELSPVDVVEAWVVPVF